jgi:hypothetical protein
VVAASVLVGVAVALAAGACAGGLAGALGWPAGVAVPATIVGKVGGVSSPGTGATVAGWTGVGAIGPSTVASRSPAMSFRFAITRHEKARLPPPPCCSCTAKPAAVLLATKSPFESPYAVRKTW